MSEDVKVPLAPEEKKVAVNGAGPREVDMSKKYTLVLQLDYESNQITVNGQISNIKDAYASLEMARDAIQMWNIINTGYMLPPPLAHKFQEFMIKIMPKPDHKKPGGMFGKK